MSRFSRRKSEVFPLDRFDRHPLHQKTEPFDG